MSCVRTCWRRSSSSAFLALACSCASLADFPGRCSRLSDEQQADIENLVVVLPHEEGRGQGATAYRDSPSTPCVRPARRLVHVSNVLLACYRTSIRIYRTWDGVMDAINSGNHTQAGTIDTTSSSTCRTVGAIFRMSEPAPGPNRSQF